MNDIRRVLVVGRGGGGLTAATAFALRGVEGVLLVRRRGFDGIRSATRQHLYATAFVPRPSGYGAWRVQVTRPPYVRGMEFLQGIGSKTGAMPLSDNLMYVFHIRPEAADAVFKREDFADLFKARLAQYGSFVAEGAAALGADSEILFSPIEPSLVPVAERPRPVVI